MKLLLDTHILLWAAGEPRRLSEKALALINSQENELFFSVASLWEVVIKNALGRKDFKADASVLRRGLLDNGYIELPIASEHAVTVGSLPLIHKDPFDRILIAQAITEGFTLVTADSTIIKYPGPVLEV
ncbi:type II toxin-antitoxin system VapC family toxin [Alkalimarinus coralli]|uniref:type II toxin-antitoxin system VapC family toxin n=1 Tax=Alkalimarinus coralli TaxID=2935863 RepID=UPI00202B5BDE|nr:type II toxin-antitoxin system VapC family toxin [Alkalimarinus coralli]